MKTPVIDISECVLCDICVELCPDIFIKNQAGYIEVSDSFPEIIDKYLNEDTFTSLDADGCEKELLIKRLEEDINDVIKSCIGGCISWGEKTQTDNI
ncbi:MAG: ferredoxin [Desulfamplus sp.]|nr:ferredoxin [Desulfamplus sp.]